VYRTQWTNHEVKYSSSQRTPASVYISREYLTNAVGLENKVYTTDGVGLTWSNEPRIVGI